MKMIANKFFFGLTIGLLVVSVSTVIIINCDFVHNKKTTPQTDPIDHAGNPDMHEKTVQSANTASPETVIPENQENINSKPQNEIIDKKVPILYYHAINDETYGLQQLFVRPSEFEKQMEYISTNYTPIHFNQLRNINEIANPIIITLDDGYRDNYTNAFPIFKKYNIKATIFLVPEYLNKPGYLSKNHIEEMKQLISFQSHTMTHKELDTLSIGEIDEQVKNSKQFIEQITNQNVNVLCYPVGKYNDKVINIVKKYYDYAVTTQYGFYNEQDDKYKIKRIYVKRDDGFETYVRKLK